MHTDICLQFDNGQTFVRFGDGCSEEVFCCSRNTEGDRVLVFTVYRHDQYGYVLLKYAKEKDEVMAMRFLVAKDLWSGCMEMLDQEEFESIYEHEDAQSFRDECHKPGLFESLFYTPLILYYRFIALFR